MTVTPAETFLSETEWDSNNLRKRQLNVTENLDTIVDAKCIATNYPSIHNIDLKNAIGFLILHIFGLWGLAITLTEGIMLKTFLWRKRTLNFLIGY